MANVMKRDAIGRDKKDDLGPVCLELRLGLGMVMYTRRRRKGKDDAKPWDCISQSPMSSPYS